MKKAIIISICFFIKTFTFGQNNTQPLASTTLSEALDIAVKNYPSIKAKLAEKNISDYYLKAAKTDYLPDVIVQDQYQFATNNSEVGATFPNEGSLPSVSGGVRAANIYQPVWGSFTSLQVNWRVVTFGKVKANIDIAQKAVDRQQYDYENEIFQHQIRVADGYLALLVFQKVVNVQTVNLQRAITFRDVIHAHVISGLRAGIDSSFATAEVSKAKLLLLQSQQNERSQRLHLAELLGKSSGVVAIDSMRFYQNLPQVISRNDNFQQNPLVKVYHAQIDYINAHSEAIKKSFYPNISLDAAFWGRSSGVNNATGEYSSNWVNGLSYQVGNYLLGVGIRWNITPFYRIRHEVNAELQRVEQYQQLLSEQELRLQRQTENANIQIELSLEQAREAPVQTMAAMGAFRQATARYESGLATLPELSQTFSLLNRAEIDQSIANNDVWRALLLKAAAVGDLSIFLNQIK